jgi:hypothetical protein
MATFGMEMWVLTTTPMNPFCMTHVFFTATMNVSWAAFGLSPALIYLPVEFHTFRAARYRTNRPHIRAYHKLVDMTPPAEDHDDRIALCGMYASSVDPSDVQS